MKKLILTMLIVLPVVLIALTVFGTRTIIAEIKTFPVESITISYGKLGTNSSQKKIKMQRGEEIDLKQYITLYPEKSSFSGLAFVSSNSDVVDVEDGVLTAKANMRSSDGMGIEIDIKTADLVKTFDKFLVQVLYTPGDPLEYMAFNLSFCTQLGGNFFANGDVLEINSAQNTEFSFIVLLDVAPVELKNDDIDSLLTWDLSGCPIIEQMPNGYMFKVISTGEGIIKVKTDNGLNAELKISVI